jgi:hypothetical protein
MIRRNDDHEAMTVLEKIKGQRFKKKSRVKDSEGKLQHRTGLCLAVRHTVYCNTCAHLICNSDTSMPKEDYFLLPCLSKSLIVNRLSPRLCLASVRVPFNFGLTGLRERDVPGTVNPSFFSSHAAKQSIFSPRFSEHLHPPKTLKTKRETNIALHTRVMVRIPFYDGFQFRAYLTHSSQYSVVLMNQLYFCTCIWSCHPEQTLIEYDNNETWGGCGGFVLSVSVSVVLKL